MQGSVALTPYDGTELFSAVVKAPSTMTIGQLARAAGVNVETVRYYQRRGLLEVPRKQRGGVRHYAESVLQTLRLVRRLKGLGFSLQEAGAVLALRERGGDVRAQLLEIFLAKELSLRADIRELEVALSAVSRLRTQLDAISGASVWSLLEPVRDDA